MLLTCCLINSSKNLPLLFESMFCVVMYVVNLGRFILGDEVFKCKNLVPSSLEAQSFSERSVTLGLEWESGWSFLFIIWVVNTWDRYPPEWNSKFQNRILPVSLSQKVNPVYKRHPK